MTSGSGFKVEVASVPDREDVVAEVWFFDDLFAELRRENGVVRIQIYGLAKGGAWDFDDRELQTALEQARKKLG
jgi:hypothetical protein